MGNATSTRAEQKNSPRSTNNLQNRQISPNNGKKSSTLNGQYKRQISTSQEKLNYKTTIPINGCDITGSRNLNNVLTSHINCSSCSSCLGDQIINANSLRNSSCTHSLHTQTVCCNLSVDTCAEQLENINMTDSGEKICNECALQGQLTGYKRIRNTRFDKGLAFTIKERQLLGIHGLLPPVVKTPEEQIYHCMAQLDRYENNLNKYIYLNGLNIRHEKLFYMAFDKNIEKFLPLVYTPTVGEACQKFSLIYQKCKGLFITIHDKGHICDILRNWPESYVEAIVVTDGERILGLGDLGANGMGIPNGKLALYTALGGIMPHKCLPITLDVGTNNKELLEDPFYIGIPQKRVTGVEYDEFIDEFMQAVSKKFGKHCLVQFEDFGNANAFKLLEKYRDTNCVFNDDIQGTASVGLAGLLASLKITQNQLKDNLILFLGAGEANLGISKLAVMAMMKEGLTQEEARKKIWLVDSRGLIVKNRPSGGISGHKEYYAHEHEPVDTLLEAVKCLKPNVIIGAAAVKGAFNEDVLKLMAEFNEHPIVFALSNPTSKAECTAEEAYKYTKGKCIFASGSPFEPVEYEGKTFYPGQGNNAYIFPGVALGVITSKMLTIPEEVFLLAAEKLASLCSNEDLERGSLYPPLNLIKTCSLAIAVEIMDYAFKNGYASLHPKPVNYAKYIKSEMYDLVYYKPFPETYEFKSENYECTN